MSPACAPRWGVGVLMGGEPRQRPRPAGRAPSVRAGDGGVGYAPAVTVARSLLLLM